MEPRLIPIRLCSGQSQNIPHIVAHVLHKAVTFVNQVADCLV